MRKNFKCGHKGLGEYCHRCDTAIKLLDRAKKALLSSHPKKELSPQAWEKAGNASTNALMSTLEQGRKWGVYTKEDIKKVLDVIKDRQLSLLLQETNPVIVKELKAMASTIGKEVTQMVPISNVQASSLTPNFDTIRGFFLTGHQKHPKYIDWVPAEEIGAMFGLSADQARKYTNQYAASRGRSLANVVAKQAVKTNGGYFRGVSSLVDDAGLPCFIDIELGCAGIWYLMEDGMLVWRNYWSPSAVAVIKGYIESAGHEALAASKRVTLPSGGQQIIQPGATFTQQPLRGFEEADHQG